MLHFEKDVCDMSFEEASRAYAHAVRNLGAQAVSQLEADPHENTGDSDHLKLCKRLFSRMQNTQPRAA